MAKLSHTLLLVLLLASPIRGELIRLDEPPQEWQPIIAELATSGSLQCSFEESRENPFQKRPKRFSGRMWWHPDIGLSLVYEEPSRLIVNVLPEGVLFGRPDSEMEPLPGSEQQQVMTLFSKLFNWDAAWLSENFRADGEFRGAGNWILSLRPLTLDFEGLLSRIDLEGDNCLMQRIRLDLRGGRSVEIRLSDQVRNGPISQDELRIAFPSSDE